MDATISIRRLTVALVLLLVLVMVIATTSGVLVLRKNFRTADNRFAAEAEESLQQGALAVRNQLRFYTSILRSLADDPRLADIAVFADDAAANAWARRTVGVLPDTLGLGIATSDGTLVGDADRLRVGTRCRVDLQRFARGEPVRRPPVHREVPGLAHFDLYARIADDRGETVGVLLLSFRLEALQQLLDDILTPGHRFLLHDANGRLLAANPPLPDHQELRQFASTVPDTDWRITLETPYENLLRFYAPLVMTDLTAIGVVILVVMASVRRVMGLFRADLGRVHQALLDVSKGRFSPSQAPPAIRETAELMPDIEALAAQLQERQHQLALQSITDDLTGLHNRRYFDLMLPHVYEQSTRRKPSYLAVIDLDGFKLVNDRHGHAAGDVLLRHVAGYLRDNVRSSDTVARIGGDEFALLLHNMSPQALESWLQHLLAEFDRNVQARGFGACGAGPCTLSVGLAPVDAARFRNAKAVLDAADQAMYRAKRARLGRSHAGFDFGSQRTAAGA